MHTYIQARSQVYLFTFEEKYSFKEASTKDFSRKSRKDS